MKLQEDNGGEMETREGANYELILTAFPAFGSEGLSCFWCWELAYLKSNATNAKGKEERKYPHTVWHPSYEMWLWEASVGWPASQMRRREMGAEVDQIACSAAPSLAPHALKKQNKSSSTEVTTIGLDPSHPINPLFRFQKSCLK